MTRHEPFGSNPEATWHEEADVVVIGYGYAGAVAALEAHDAGADVLLIEKMPDPGGISITSGGNVRMVEECGGRLPAPAGNQRGDHARFRAAGARGRNAGDTCLFREAFPRVRGPPSIGVRPMATTLSRAPRRSDTSASNMCPDFDAERSLSLRLELRPHSSRRGRAPVQGARRQRALPPDAGHAGNAGTPIDHGTERRDPRRHGGTRRASRSRSRRAAPSFSPAAASRRTRTCSASSGRKSRCSMPPIWAIPATAS